MVLRPLGEKALHGPKYGLPPAARHLGYVEVNDLADMRLKAGISEFPETTRVPGSDEPGFKRSFDAELLWDYPSVRFYAGGARYSLQNYKANGYAYADADQPYRLEAWFEKEVGTDALLPVCRESKVHLLVGVGNISISQADLLLSRSIGDGRNVRLLYFADFDVAGHGVPVSVARQLKYLIHRKYQPEANIALHRVAVTPAQIRGDNPRGSRIPRKDVYLKCPDPLRGRTVQGRRAEARGHADRPRR